MFWKCKAKCNPPDSLFQIPATVGCSATPMHFWTVGGNITIFWIQDIKHTEVTELYCNIYICFMAPVYQFRSYWKIRHSKTSLFCANKRKILSNYEKSQKKKKSIKSHNQKGAETMNRCFNICIALKIAFFFVSQCYLGKRMTSWIIQYRPSEIYVRLDVRKTVSETIL